MTKLRILFFTPFGGYTGSEMMLWYLMSNLDREEFEIKLFSFGAGKLLKEYPKHIEVEQANIGGNSLISKVNGYFRKKLRLSNTYEKQIMRLHTKFDPHLWYVNTMILNSVTDLALKYRIKYIIHFHELLSQYNNVTSMALEKMVKGAYLTIGCSEKVCSHLRTLEAKSVFKQYECIDFTRIKIDTKEIRALREKLQINSKAFVILMSGHRIERKGFDVFVETAIRLQNTNYHFVWLGESLETGYDHFLKQRIKETKTLNISLIVPEPANYYNHLNLADLFFLTSREDPFPLVMIEAAYLKKPILAFNSGGSEEFVNNKIGKVLTSIDSNSIDSALDLMVNEIRENKYSPDEIHDYAKQFDVTCQAILFQNWLKSHFQV